MLLSYNTNMKRLITLIIGYVILRAKGWAHDTNKYKWKQRTVYTNPQLMKQLSVTYDVTPQKKDYVIHDKCNSRLVHLVAITLSYKNEKWKKKKPNSN